MFPHVSPGVLVQRLYDADLKREISRVWPSLPQKTVDLLVTPHKCQQTQIHVVLCGHTVVISASIKLSNFGVLQDLSARTLGCLCCFTFAIYCPFVGTASPSPQQTTS